MPQPSRNSQPSGPRLSAPSKLANLPAIANATSEVTSTNWIALTLSPAGILEIQTIYHFDQDLRTLTAGFLSPASVRVYAKLRSFEKGERNSHVLEKIKAQP